MGGLADTSPGGRFQFREPGHEPSAMAPVGVPPTGSPAAWPALPGQPLWGTAPPRQPLLPLVVLALITMVIAAPVAFSGAGGESANPIKVMGKIASVTYEMTGLVDDSNELLRQIDENSRPLAQQRQAMEALATETGSMVTSTEKLSVELDELAATSATARGRLGEVAASLGGLQQGVAGMADTVGATLATTRAMNRDFATVDKDVSAMRRILRRTIGELGTAAPLTKAFAENRTVKDIAGGDPTRYGEANVAAGSRVMSVVLPLIDVLQDGGKLVARKDSAEASNIVVGTVLRRQVPDGTNIAANVRPWNGREGLPPPRWFVGNRVGGM